MIISTLIASYPQATFLVIIGLFILLILAGDKIWSLEKERIINKLQSKTAGWFEKYYLCKKSNDLE